MRGPEQPIDDLERDLSRILREPLTPTRVDLLDARMERLAAQAVADAEAAGGRWALPRWRRAISTFGALTATVVAVVVVVTALASGRAQGPATGSPSAIALETGSAVPASPSPIASPSMSDEPGASASAAPDPSASASASASAAPDPTPDTTPRVTPKPTAKPTPDPRPEPTPVIYTGSGRLGQAVTVHGITITMARADIPSTVGDVCPKYDRETLGYTLHVTWPDPMPNSEPWMYVGATPFYVIWWEPAYAVNADVATVLCHVPGEGENVHIEIADGVDLVRWTLRP